MYPTLAELRTARALREGACVVPTPAVLMASSMIPWAIGDGDFLHESVPTMSWDMMHSEQRRIDMAVAR